MKTPTNQTPAKAETKKAAPPGNGESRTIVHIPTSREDKYELDALYLELEKLHDNARILREYGDLDAGPAKTYTFNEIGDTLGMTKDAARIIMQRVGVKAREKSRKTFGGLAGVLEMLAHCEEANSYSEGDFINSTLHNGKHYN